MVKQGTWAILIISNISLLPTAACLQQGGGGPEGLKSFIVPFLTPTALTSKELSDAGSL